MTLKVADASPASENLDPAAAGTVMEPGAEGSAVDANPADPSPVDQTDANQPASLLDVIKGVVEKPADAGESSTTENEPANPTPEAPAEAAAEAEPAAEDDANLPFHNHPRWKAVIAERDTLRDPASRWQAIDGFMQQHGLTGDEMAEGYEIMALLKSGDPAKLAEARGWFHERLNALDETLGNVLPDDLQQRVNDGLLDEDGALEIAQARANAALSSRQVADRDAAEATRRQQEQAVATTTEMVSAVEGWEARIKASDPDYSKKADLVQAKCVAIVQQTGKAPTTAAEATALADRALSEVNASLAAVLPKPRPITPTPAGMSTPAAAAPKTLREAINGALGR